MTLKINGIAIVDFPTVKCRILVFNFSTIRRVFSTAALLLQLTSRKQMGAEKLIGIRTRRENRADQLTGEKR